MDPESIRTLLDLGASGLLIVAVWALATGRVVPGKERDEWKAIANSAVARLDRISDLVDDLIRRAT